LAHVFRLHPLLSFYFFTTPPPTPIYTLSLHDALPISPFAASSRTRRRVPLRRRRRNVATHERRPGVVGPRLVFRKNRGRSTRCRSEEHTSELQSRSDLVCRLLLEKKKKNIK